MSAVLLSCSCYCNAVETLDWFEKSAVHSPNNNKFTARWTSVGVVRSSQECYIQIYGCSYRHRYSIAKPCLHVVKQALKNYVNVAMMWTAIQVGYTDSVYFVDTERCVGGWSQNVSLCLCWKCTCLWVSNVATKPAHCGLRGKKVSALHQHRPTFTDADCWQHCSGICNFFFCMQNTNTTCTHTYNPILNTALHVYTYMKPWTYNNPDLTFIIYCGSTSGTYPCPLSTTIFHPSAIIC